MPAMPAAISALAIILAETDTAQSAKAINGKNGYIGPPKRAREADLLPVPYFHVVFTLPNALNGLALEHPKWVYDSLFAAAWQTLETFGKNKGLQLGMISILHTWGRSLSLHPHLHCIVPGGGVDKNGKWQNIRADGKFLFAVKALSKVFRAKYVAELSKRLEIGKPLRQVLFAQNWIVYAKRPFGSPKAVVEYLVGAPLRALHA